MADTKKYTEDDVQKAKALIAEAEKQEQERAAKERAEAMKPKKFKPGRWVCVKECYHQDRFWAVGDVADWKKQSEAPITDGYVAHFQPEA